MIDVDLRSRDEADEGPLRFWVATDAWRVGYEADFRNGQLIYSCSETIEIELVTGRGTAQPLSAWLNEKEGLTFLLDGDRLLNKGQLYEPNHRRRPFPVGQLRTLDWTDTDIHVESQGSERRVDSIQARVIRQLQDDDAWNVVIDDDGSGEIADVVALKIDEDGLLIHFFHCKYAGGEPGARVADLYELCGQAQKSVRWRRSDIVPFFKNLERRARKKYKRTDVSPFEVGNIDELYRLQEHGRVLKRRLEITIVQPGVSAAVASDVQLELLAATETYLRNTVNAPMYVWCSR